MTDKIKNLGNHQESIFLAVLLYLLGEKSLIIASLIIHGFDNLFKGRSPSTEFVYEFSLVGLMIGTCLVVFISKFRQKQLKKDNLAIFIGIITATLAALFNIAEVILEDSNKYGPIPSKALFFFALWTLLVIMPMFLRVIQRGNTQDIDITLLLHIITALLVATFIGLCVRPIISAILLYGLEVKNANSLNGAYDWMRFNSDSLIMLGAVWWVATFGKHSDIAHRIWRILYIVAAPIAGFFYAYFVSFPDGDALYNVSAMRLGIGFAALSFAVVIPGIWFAEKTLNLDKKALGFGMLSTFLICGLAMFVGLSSTLPFGLTGQITVSVLQGLAGACILIAVYSSAWLIKKYASSIS